MSETVIEKGKLKLIKKLDNETLEEQCKRILSSRLNDLAWGWHPTYEVALIENFYDDYYVCDDNVYSLNYDSLEAYTDIVEWSVKENKTIDFFVSYYNGGASLHEMLDTIMNNIKKENLLESDANNDNKKIMSTCLECGSHDISIKEDIAYDYEEMPFVTGFYLKCNNCGNISDR